MNRRTNAHLIKKFLASHGDFALAHLSVDAKVSITLIEKLANGTYPWLPRETTRDRLCKATGYSEDELFPLAKESAS